MACLYCGDGSEGGYECPVCWCDYCKDHYEEHVKQSQGERVVINDVCQLCGCEL